ncbi:MAG: tRNA pseudouridine(55) synthase TruB [Blastocatellia bacterium]|nr:tRNA pseudouridine(55) synthase TruB [Blastocatellia bacterium]
MYSGAVLVDKPAGITSHDLVAKVRKVLKQKRVGHTGTLDPFATGLMIVCFGKATRLVQFLTGEDKSYIATVRIGFATDTQDITGTKISEQVDTGSIDKEIIRTMLSSFVGKQEQIPPMYSAKKIAGQALYKLARKGEVIDRKTVTIVVKSINLVDEQIVVKNDETREFTMMVDCSAGTYIRTLAHDIGQRLGCGAHLSGLKRVRIGDFGLEDSVSLEKLMSEGSIEKFLLTPDRLMSNYPKYVVADEQIEKVKHGQGLKVSDQDFFTDLGNWVRILDNSSRLVALAQVLGSEERSLQPKIVLVD